MPVFVACPKCGKRLMITPRMLDALGRELTEETRDEIESWAIEIHQMIDVCKEG